MQLTETVKLKLNKEQIQLIHHTMDEYINAVNHTVSLAVNNINISKFGSGDIVADIPSACKNQVVRDAKSIIKKHYKTCHKAVLKNRKLIKQNKSIRVTVPNLPVVKRKVCYWNNQNFEILDNGNIKFPVMINGKSKRIEVETTMTDRQLSLFKNTHLGTMRIVSKNNVLIVNIAYEVPESISLTDGNVMGVDLGIKCPAVSYISDGKIKFYGNGRKNKYMRRFYIYQCKKLQKSKKIDVVKRINNKEQCIMKDIDHKISHDIIKEAVAHNVKVIKLEQLSNIRSTTRTSRKNNHSLHNWSFYRLAQFIEYKAKLAGIEVLYVNPAYTSQKCPVCGKEHHANDRHYDCDCGYKRHRDIVGAINICNTTEIVGNRLSA